MREIVSLKLFLYMTGQTRYTRRTDKGDENGGGIKTIFRYINTS